MSGGSIQVYRGKKLCHEHSIDDLPNDVLISIISRLPMVDAVRTSVLSKSWEYKWTSTDYIKIHEHPKIIKKASLVNFIDRILFLTQIGRAFSLDCHSLRDPTNLKAWISSLSMSTSMKHIYIVSVGCGRFTIPRSLFYTTSLTRLRLNLPCTMEFPLKGYFSTLKSLNLHYVEFKTENFSSTDNQRLRLTFPVLEYLELQLCTWGNNVKFVEISSPSLTNFHYTGCLSVARDFLIKICGAKLERFSKGGNVLLSNFDLNTSSMVHGVIQMRPRRDHPFIGAIGSKPRMSIKDLSGLITLEIIGRLAKPYAQLMPGLALPSFRRLRDLTIQVCGSMEAFIELLHMMPVLKLLHITPHTEKGHSCRYSADFDFDAAGRVPSCISSHLIEIRFNDFSGTKWQLSLAKFLLKNSAKLEKLDVYFHEKPLKQKSIIEEQLLTYPKSSACISILFP